MIQLSRKSLMALEAVLDVALHARPNPVQAREITERQGVPQRYLEQIMQALVKANILRGVRGPRGGYRLARERRRISVREIFEVIEALDKETDGVSSRSDLCREIVEPFHAQLQTALGKAVGDTSIADLCHNSETQQQDVGNFTI
jgi:Rrf2 family iron-sulfur cluster assembly transcriptional regulator